MESERVKEEEEASTDVESIDVPQDLMSRKSYVSSLRMEGKRTMHIQDLRDYEMEATGEEEKIDLLDEALQEGVVDFHPFWKSTTYSNSWTTSVAEENSYSIRTI